MASSAARRQAAVFLAAALAAVLAFQGVPAPTLPTTALDPDLSAVTSGSVDVIVRADAAGSAADAVRRAGGTVTRDLSIVDGVGATLPVSAIEDLVRSGAITSITLDRAVTLLGGPSEGASVYQAFTRADDTRATGVDGSGVTVAVIDTGIADVQDFSGRIVQVVNPATGQLDSCANFSGEAGCADSYGHGTFVAGILAGDGQRSGGEHAGVAPGANLLSVKLAGRDGAADVSTLLAAIQWLVTHQQTYDIKVMNLSLGSDSPQPYYIDPLNYAVEQAWQAGITVVVAASNRGPGPATITKPADDPWVITVGAIDDRGTLDASDDLVPNFSARGPTLSDGHAKPDLVAPGAHVVSLVAPGSAVAENFPATINNAYRKGSGTSFATPAVAGAIALMLEADPTLTPDRIKFALTSTAKPTASSDPYAVGAGMIDIYDATFAAPPGSANQGLLQSDGTGSLHASRGTLLVVADDLTSTLINGLMTQQLQLFDALEYTGASWHGASWHDSQWFGASWHGASWHGASWHGASWHGASWHGASWHEADGSEPSYGTGLLGSSIYGAWE